METTGTVQSVDRALALLEALGGRAEGARLSDLAREVGLAPSTAHRLLTTLERNGFAQFDPNHTRWHVGRKAFSVGVAFGNWQSFIAAAMPFLRRLRDTTRETANLGILQESEVITVAQVESREIIRATASPGGRTPVLNSGMGKAIIATWPDDAIEALVDRHGFRPLTRHSLHDREALWSEIARIRKRGFAYDNEEFTRGMRCVAAVVWSPSGEPLGGLSVSALSLRLAQADMPALGARIRDQALALTAVLGGRPPEGS
ncbi:IclR family transcriptional regulator [Pararhodobacter sp. CCB-MM2]|uniref:IclR family transcriptional regulator n=1 Tax=Pararhodobacter sp. CCB-MM2 TaxID=1786003 RepID=UPI000836D9A6|nr:IclR family transcriptional regulator [Pararhodobacter sp. CCB-MM2]